MRKRVRRIAIEGLEHREMLAGDCAVAINDGVLTVECDNQANSVDILGPSMFLSLTSGDGTTFNGQESLVIADPQGIDELRINTNGGNDQVSINTDVDAVYIETGNGNDEVAASIIGASILDIDGGNGQDDIALGLAAAATIHVQGGNGKDSLTGLALIGDITFDGGNGKDSSEVTDFFGSLNEISIEV